MTKTKFLFLSDPIILAFLIPLFYWIYLFSTTEMIMVYDALSFERFGSILFNSGWVRFFQTKPESEPLFPFFISISMTIAQYFSVPYQFIQKFFHMGSLFLTQLLSLYILKKLNVGRSLIAGTIFYLGISPALVNSAFSLWSEIMTYPFVLGIVMISLQSWKAILHKEKGDVALHAVVLAVLFILITCVKAIFEYVFWIYCLPFFYLIISSWIKRSQRILIHSCLFYLVLIFIFYSFLLSYKSVNQKMNGHFVITISGPSLLYGTVAQRTQPLTSKEFFSCLASIPGQGVCERIFDPPQCFHWSLIAADQIGYTKLYELNNKGVPNERISKELVHLTTLRIIQNPWQYAFLTILESFKMFFWESTKIGFVHYPVWLSKIFDFSPFKDGLRFLVFLITFFSVVYVTRYILNKRLQIFSDNSHENSKADLLFFILLFIFSYLALYSLFHINTRYALPIAPLYLILCAYTIHKITAKK